MSNNTSQPINVIDLPIMLFDGGSLRNPGQGAAAAVLLMPNGRRYTVSRLLSFTTQQEAEYTGLIIGIRKAKNLGIQELEIKGSSEVVFNQVNGLTTINEEKLQSLCREARQLMKTFDRVTLEWIPPEQNRSAKAAVNRCIEEALGKETATKSNPTPPIQLPVTPEITRLIELGTQATPEDYHNLTVPLDELTFKPLLELSTLVGSNMQKAIALQWQGNEQDLGEIYRWYLRGLPPGMAIEKVNLDRELENNTLKELLWSDPSSDFPPLEPVEPEFAAPFPLTSIPLPDEDIFASIPSLEKLDSEQAKSSLDLPKPEKRPDPSRDTLPSDGRVIPIIEMIETLCTEEKIVLVRELVKLPDVVNLMLKAIADKMAGGNP